MKRLAEETNDIPFFLLAAPVDLVADHADIIGTIRLSVGGKALAMVVLDTLNRSLRGSESSDEDMGAYVKAADAIRETFECAVVIVHHCGVDDKRPRGHTSLTGAVDAQLAVKRDGGANFTTTVEWMKDGPEGETITSRLAVVEVGTDADGDPITSCVVEAVESVEADRPTTRRLSDRQRLALSALTRVIADRGAPAPAVFDLPVSVITAQITDWREELTSGGTLDKNAKNPRADFLRLKDALQARHLIAERDGLIWPLKA